MTKFKKFVNRRGIPSLIAVVLAAFVTTFVFHSWYGAAGWVIIIAAAVMMVLDDKSAANLPAPRASAAPSMNALPRITPLVLKRRAQAFDNPDWLFELKIDGFRALLEIDDSGARLVSRNRNRFRHLDPLAAALAKRLRVTNAVLDGEVCCVDETGRPIFIDLLRRQEPCFVAFDLLWLNGEDLRPLPLVERKKRLKRLLRRRCNHLIAEAMSVDGRGKALMAAVEQHDLEGIVAKRKADPYRRGVTWWKIKNRVYSQVDDGRGELLNGDGRAIPQTARPA